MSPLTIRRTILSVLGSAKPFAVPAETLLAEVNRLVRPAIKSVDLAEHLTALQGQQMIDYIADPVAPDDATARKWHIKEAGEAAFRS
ncbi:MAG: hypothetical protein WC661_21305 [Opitutaceae bacterium]|jgi:hypothetical protein